MTRKPASRSSQGRPTTQSNRPAREDRGSKRSTSGERASRSGPSRRDQPRTDPKVRSRAAKVTTTVARLLRAGHPWVFRDALPRDLEGTPAGTLVPVLDDNGHTVGWGLTEPEGVVALRMVSLLPDLRWDRDEVLARVQAAQTYREACIEPANRSACRLVHGEADGIPGVGVDRLGDYLLIYKYARCAESYLDELVPVLEQVFSPRGIYVQDRLRAVTAEERRPAATHAAGRVAPPEYEVEEDGLRFLVDVTAPVSPGLFLDLREGRRLCERHVEGKTVLNLFSFTGAFAARAVRGGARAVCNVDAAARSHARCRQNLSASGLDSEACEVLSGDCFKHLERLRQRGRRFELVVADPPPFSNVKGAVFSAIRDWSRLIEAIVPVVEPGGHVLAVCNAARVSDQDYLLALGEGCEAAKRQVRVVDQRGLPPDFPVPPAFGEGRYLKIRLLHLP